ncbi:hypothetical protein [Alicyclobacillus sendaiensis]|uniref:hypothetical protein n=1 Tax=Alicyclobacillus sendaiensis TaxID=192387 RepID=UPI0026F43F5C|nr:hypothetical protein [Alicyclobacillus sendaiensis]
MAGSVWQTVLSGILTSGFSISISALMDRRREKKMRRSDMLQIQYERFYLPAYRLIERFIHPESTLSYIIWNKEFEKEWEQAFDSMKALVEDAKDYVSKLTYELFAQPYEDLDIKKRNFVKFCNNVVIRYLESKKVYEDEDIKRQYGGRVFWLIAELRKRRPPDVTRREWSMRRFWMISDVLEPWIRWWPIAMLFLEAIICGYVVWRVHQIEIMQHHSFHQGISSGS